MNFFLILLFVTVYVSAQHVSTQFSELKGVVDLFGFPHSLYRIFSSIRFSIPNVGARSIVPVQLKVFDMLGNAVATLVDVYKPAGSYEVEFQSAIGNRQLASRVYYYQLSAGELTQTKKMILLR